MIDQERRELVAALKTAATAVAFLWLLHLLRLLLGMSATSWGIVPRDLGGLHGILTAPLAHGGWGHLANNTVPLFACTALLVYFFPRIAARAMLVMYVLTGVAVWLLARGAGWGADVSISHVGASGVAYALVSFLFWMGAFKRSVQSVVVALVIALYFSGMVAGVLPNQLNVSWESHLLGGLVGMWTAWTFRTAAASRTPEPVREAYVAEPYFPRDAFAYTRAERETMRLAAEREAAEREAIEREAAERQTRGGSSLGDWDLDRWDSR